MAQWTPDEVRHVLKSGERPRRKELMTEVCRAVEVGRAHFLYSRAWLRHSSDRNQQDDVHDVIVRLLERDARLLIKYGDYTGFVLTEDSLKKYVIGITWNVMRKIYQKPTAYWKEVREDIASLDEDPGYYRGMARFVHVLDLERAVASLSLGDQELFGFIYVDQLDPTKICSLREISRQAFAAQKSRLLKRLVKFMNDESGRKSEDGDDV